MNGPSTDLPLRITGSSSNRGDRFDAKSATILLTRVMVFRGTCGSVSMIFLATRRYVPSGRLHSVQPSQPVPTSKLSARSGSRMHPYQVIGHPARRGSSSVIRRTRSCGLMFGRVLHSCADHTSYTSSGGIADCILIGVLLTRKFARDDISSVHAGGADKALAPLVEWGLGAGHEGFSIDGWEGSCREQKEMRYGERRSPDGSEYPRARRLPHRICTTIVRVVQFQGSCRRASAHTGWTGFGEVDISSSTLSNRFGTNARFLSCPIGADHGKDVELIT